MLANIYRRTSEFLFMNIVSFIAAPLSSAYFKMQRPTLGQYWRGIWTQEGAREVYDEIEQIQAKQMAPSHFYASSFADADETTGSTTHHSSTASSTASWSTSSASASSFADDPAVTASASADDDGNGGGGDGGDDEKQATEPSVEMTEV